MKHMKKILSLLVIFSVLLLAGCQKKAPEVTATPEAQATEEKKQYTVGIVQLVQHEALDAATKGFMDVLNEKLPDQVTFDVQNASGDSANCTTIVNGFVAKKVDLIMANATPALQAAASATSTIPILGTSVTHYAPALDIENWTGTVGTNVSGTSDLADLKLQATMIPEWFPEAKTVGLFYCSSEANSAFQVEEVEKYLAELGLETKRFSFTDTNDVASVAQAACNETDVIYIPTDNTAAANAEAIANVILPAEKPAIVGEMGICKGCGVATLTISYEDLGRATGEMAYKVLVEGAKVQEMPIEFAPNLEKYYNPNVCEQLGITPLEGYKSLQD